MNKKLQDLEYQVKRAHIESCLLMSLASSIGKTAHNAMKEYLKLSDRLEKAEKKKKVVKK